MSDNDNLLNKAYKLALLCGILMDRIKELEQENKTLREKTSQ